MALVVQPLEVEGWGAAAWGPFAAPLLHPAAQPQQAGGPKAASAAPYDHRSAHTQGVPLWKAPAAAVAPLVVSPRHRHQVVRHFGASDAWAAQFVGTWPLEKRQAIADLLFSTALEANGRPRGIGLSAWRFNIGAGSAEQGADSGISDEWRRAECFLRPDGTFDWNKQAGGQWFARAARRAGVRHLTAFVNSPPVHFTRNGRAFCGAPDACNLDPAHAPHFAAFLVLVLQQLRSMGIPFDAVSPVNEPQWQWLQASGQEGCHFKTADIRNIVQHLSHALSHARLPVTIDIPEAAHAGFLLDAAQPAPGLGQQLRELFGPGGLAADSMVSRHVAAHSYGTTFPLHDLVGLRRELRRQMQLCDPSLEYWMTEYCLVEHNAEVVGEGRAADDIKPALYMARVIHYDLAVASASSWSWWLAVSPYDYKDGLVYVDKQRSDGGFHASKLLWALGHFSRFIRPGARRVALLGYDETDPQHATALMVSAYVHDADQEIVVVCVNYPPSPRPFALQVDGTAVETFTPYVTDAGRNLQPSVLLRVGHTCILPGASIVTFVGKVGHSRGQ